MSNDLFEQVDEYINRLVTHEDDALLAVEKSIRDENMPQISVSPSQGKFLHVMAKLINAKKILEMGTLAAYSTIWMARALPKAGKLTTIEFDPHHAAVAKKNIDRAGVGHLIDIRIGKALDILPKLKEEGLSPFDMIFIDADKPPYLEYFEWAIQLSRPGTLIIADNVIREGKILDSKTDDPMVIGVDRLNKSLEYDKRVTASIMQTVGSKQHDGMVIAVVNE
jgi:caffeoyl-CoA O-methyltransferase